MFLGKKEIDVRKALIVSYIVVSALFIVLSMVSYLKVSVYNVWVQNWVETAITQVMQKAVDPKCEAFSVFSGEAEVGLVNIKCLQQQAPDQAQQTPEQVQQVPAATQPEVQ